MASELVAAFRAIFTFLILSWGAFMYLVFYRIPSLETDYVMVPGDQETRIKSRNIHDRSQRLLAFYENKGVDSRNSVDSSDQLPKLTTNIDSSFSGEWLSSKLTQDNINRTHDWFKGLDTSMLCHELKYADKSKTLGQGYTKVVREAKLKGTPVAVKSIHLGGHDIKTCMSGKQLPDFVRCANLAKYKLLREALLLSQLRTPFIVQVLGACIWSDRDTGNRSDNDDSTVVITELGQPLSLLDIIRMAWDERLKISIDLLHLLNYLSRSPYGSIAITDFKIDQFVIVDGNAKLSDVDDLDNRPKSCTKRDDCFIGGDRWNSTLPCLSSRCLHYNEKLNLYNLYRLFLDYTLDFENPRGLERELALVAERIRKFECRVHHVLESLRSIIEQLRTGKYALKWKTAGLPPASRERFKMFQDAYVPRGLFDFYCQRSRSLTSCELSVYDIEEAEVLCTLEKACKAIVVTPDTNWLGQKIVILKTDSKILMSHSKYKVLVQT